MNNNSSRTKSSGSLIGVILILLLCCAMSVSLLFSRVFPYTSAKFVNVHPINENSASDLDTVNSEDPTNDTSYMKHHPGFRMEAKEEIFKLSYDETGKVTVIGVEGNEDKLIAPGTSNIYQFTLANTGDVALDYTMTMEAYVTGTDLWIPVNARVWDYKNKYLLGSADNMVDIMKLNTVNESAELGAGRNAVYNLEWEWPFERGDDEYDTMLGNLAVDEDLVLTVVIRTYAEYDEDPTDPNAGLIKPPYTGDDSNLVLLSLLCGGSFIALCAMLFTFFKSSRKKKQAEEK